MSGVSNINIKRKQGQWDTDEPKNNSFSSRQHQIYRLSQSPLVNGDYFLRHNDSSGALGSSVKSTTYYGSMGQGKQLTMKPSFVSMANTGRLSTDETFESAENPDIVRRHLGTADGNWDEFSSLNLQGGDIHRQVYRWQEEMDQKAQIRRGRSHSFSAQDVTEPLQVNVNIGDLKKAGGMRRNFIQAKASTNSFQNPQATPYQPTFLNRNFIEFLSVYGHFAGEELSEEDEDDEEQEEEAETLAPHWHAAGTQESQPLLHPRRHAPPVKGQASAGKAVLLLLKSFVGTGVLFLPKAFQLGGLAFSTITMLVVAVMSLICFNLLISTRNKIPGSFGDIGGVLFGRHMRFAILASIVVSQIGFASAYISFVASTLQACFKAISATGKEYDIVLFIVFQFFVFAPLSMVRKLTKLSATALIADFFILLGILYLYFWDVLTLATQGIADVVLFNKTEFSLFIGVAIFTYEGICLILPIQEQMANPQKLPKVLSGVMLAITILFISIGVLSYAAFGSEVQTVVILNMPQSGFTVLIQFLYAIAILLSTPLQLFPAIAIIEQSIFTRSGKRNKKVKWRKNYLRVTLVFIAILIAWGGSAHLDEFVSMVGSVCCIPLIYIYPPMLHYKACARGFWSKALDVLIGLIGTVSIIFTAYMTLV
ncbi:vacuolar amino acid efflux transporter Avt3 [Schizosaccharomyces japonicus yFS275]|uniref:Vacuolar amino acid efflux transporter Avt3 n=1 Tax=Schizosaccharomyces japonicus (strain yFS275 / FY16936) TaxID=402676 RepID=B6K447_SCHJY|nr:vacuolar amino acid efflux transporter Avt3 [Schizosaccharomyces japonicus yFS275]EEB08254.1 vacuolar amino acid efflux transporter Avt3 [Schizosaccharomyces japonicus yFS275]